MIESRGFVDVGVKTAVSGKPVRSNLLTTTVSGVIKTYLFWFRIISKYDVFSTIIEGSGKTES
jgi:hypothetical protein